VSGSNAFRAENLICGNLGRASQRDTFNSLLPFCGILAALSGVRQLRAGTMIRVETKAEHSCLYFKRNCITLAREPQIS